MSANLVTRLSHLAFDVSEAATELDRLVALCDLLDRYATGLGRGILYANTAFEADFLFRYVAAKRLSVARYHGKMSRSEREASRARFESGTVRVMVATSAFVNRTACPVSFVILYSGKSALDRALASATRADGGPAPKCVVLSRAVPSSPPEMLCAKLRHQPRPVSRSAVVQLAQERFRPRGELVARPAVPPPPRSMRSSVSTITNPSRGPNH